MKPPSQEFRDCIAQLIEAYPKQGTATKALFGAYWIALHDVPIEDVQRAVYDDIRNPGDFRPAPGALRQRATGALSADEKAIFAWQVVRNAVQRCGPYKTVSFADVAINAAVRCQWGTWPCLCDRLAEGEHLEHWLQKQFVSAYNAVQARGIGEDQAAPLGGLSQVSVRCGQLVPPEPVMIGQDVVKRLTGVSQRRAR